MILGFQVYKIGKVTPFSPFPFILIASEKDSVLPQDKNNIIDIIPFLGRTVAV